MAEAASSERGRHPLLLGVHFTVTGTLDLQGVDAHASRDLEELDLVSRGTCVVPRVNLSNSRRNGFGDRALNCVEQVPLQVDLIMDHFAFASTSGKEIEDSTTTYSSIVESELGQALSVPDWVIGSSNGFNKRDTNVLDVPNFDLPGVVLAHQNLPA